MRDLYAEYLVDGIKEVVTALRHAKQQADIPQNEMAAATLLVSQSFLDGLTIRRLAREDRELAANQ